MNDCEHCEDMLTVYACVCGRSDRELSFNPLPPDGTDPIVDVLPPPEMPPQVQYPQDCGLHVMSAHFIDMPKETVNVYIVGEKSKPEWRAAVPVGCIITGVSYDPEDVTPVICLKDAEPVRMERCK